MSKKRVYDLAKEYGMSGQDLAAKLRDYGFTKVKSHMTALSDFEELEIRGRLEAYGFTPADPEVKSTDDSGLGGLKIKRKKKKVAPVEPPVSPPSDAVASAPEEPKPDAEAQPSGSKGEIDPHQPARSSSEVASEAEIVVTPKPAPKSPDSGAKASGETSTKAREEADVRQVDEAAAAEKAVAKGGGDPKPAVVESASGSPEDASTEDSSAIDAAKSSTQRSSSSKSSSSTQSEHRTSTRESQPSASLETEKLGDQDPAAAGQGAEATAEKDGKDQPETTEQTAASAEKDGSKSEDLALEKGSGKTPQTGTEKSTAAGAKEDTAKSPDKSSSGESEKADSTKPNIVRPGDKRRAGKVVGFIDPSKFAQPEKRRTQSRRLRSRDDVVPRVMPTMGRDRNSGQVRGDQVRGSLTAQQLREREQGRFLRRRRQQTDSRGGGGRRGGGRRQEFANESPFSGETVRIEEPITIKKLANTLSVKENQVFRTAMRELGFGITINSGIDSDTAQLLAQEFDVELDIVEDVAAEEALLKDLSNKREAIGKEHLFLRPPTVAFLGHVDHGKTTLIDTIRRSRIASGESGGITQHIGAYQVETKSGNAVTVLDTPGHAAFTQMRARGASAVDIVVLVVAADDGVKPQTEEAYNHAKAAGTPMVVALNKADKPEANLERVRNELSGLGLTPEEWGGETAMLPVSALNGDGVDELLERVVLESEVLELQSYPKGPASGVVLEAEIQQGKGKVAHLLVQDGSLHRGDVILAGEGYGKVRSIHDDRGKSINTAGPSKPVQVTGLNELPSVGDTFHVVESLDKAKEVAGERGRKLRQMAQIESSKGLAVNMDNLFEAVAQADKPAINLIIKADVSGSADVLKSELAKLTNDEVEVKILHSGVGQVLESDVDLAITSGAHILAFHTSAPNKVRQKAERENIQVKIYEVIYELLDDVKRFMEGELAPELREEITGHAEVRRVFPSSKFGNIAGCLVLDGTINRNNKMRLLRDGNVVHTGSIAGLRREADAAKEVREGFECGILLQNYNDIKESDVIETFKILEIKRTL